MIFYVTTSYLPPLELLPAPSATLSTDVFEALAGLDCRKQWAVTTSAHAS